ncbi:MAG TPA: hypothetical protein VLA78_13595 [Paracoccaceae bacterium]|nr:hypothetical protein [Paracoccaceae bacterium]
MDRMATAATGLRQVIGTVAALWVLSDLGFYFLLPALGVTPDYNDSGMAVALFYTYWIGLGIILFWPVYATWTDHARWPTFQRPQVSALIWTLFFVAAVVFVAWVMPALPPFDAEGRTNPPDLPQADPWYFLPKSVDILFQQLLVVALVLSLTGAGQSFRRVSLTCGALFGISHVLLLLGGAPVGYVVRFTVMATAFGLMFPWLLLRVRNGLAYSYMLHWLFYALAVIVARVDILP